MDDYENKLERLTILDGLFANFKMAERAGLLSDVSNDCPQPTDIQRYHDGTLDQSNRAEIKKHLEVCNRCLFRAVVYVRAKLERELGVDSESIQQQVNNARERAKSKNFPGQGKGEMLVDHLIGKIQQAKRTPECPEDFELVDFIYGKAGEKANWIEGHIRACLYCRREYEFFRAGVERAEAEHKKNPQAFLSKKEKD